MIVIERFDPLAISVIISILFGLYYSCFVSPSLLLKDLISSSFVVNGVLIGFLLTITTLLHTINTRRMKFVKSMGGYSRVVKYLNTAIYLNLVSITLYLVMPFFGFAYNIFSDVCRDGILLFLVLYTWFANIRFTLIFISLIVDKED